MSNLNNIRFESYELPSNYCVKKAEEADIIGILKCELFENKISKFFWISIYPISILISLPGGYSEWKILHRSIIFERGIETLSHPDLAGWLYIFFQSVKFALIVPVICIFSLLLTFCGFYFYYRLLVNLNERNRISDHWIVKYRNKIVGEAKLRGNNTYIRLSLLSIHPQHRNKGLGSYLLLIAIRNIDKPVYLLCSSKMQSFYRRLGFVSISRQETPKSLKPMYGYKVMKLSLVDKQT